jgi:hypothetical protein
VAARRTGLTSGPSPPARDEDQALDHLGELVGELHRDAAAERVADERGSLVAEGDEQVAQAGRQRADRVVAAARGRGAMAGQVRRDHGVAARQRLDHLLPVGEGPAHPVDEEDDGAFAGLGVGDAATVERLGLDLDRLHRALIMSLRTAAIARRPCPDLLEDAIGQLGRPLHRATVQKDGTPWRLGCRGRPGSLLVALAASARGGLPAVEPFSLAT